jgi:uncharacterized RDD family membrane protein YckC
MTNPYAPPLAGVDDISEPEASALPADRGTRLGAAILDSILFVLAVYLPLTVAAFSAARLEAAPEEAERFGRLAVGGVMVALAGFVIWAGFTLKYMARNSQSIAKRWLQIKVVRADGSPVSLGRLILLRNVVVWVLSMIPLFSIVDALFIFGDARQCLHDKIADTIVVKA